MSRFSAFIEHSSNSDDSEAEADTGTLSSDKALLNAREAVEIPRQHGGSFAQRSDPITGVDWSNAMDPVQTGFSDEDIEACVRVVAGLGTFRPMMFLWKIFLICIVLLRQKSKSFQTSPIKTVTRCPASPGAGTDEELRHQSRRARQATQEAKAW